MIKKLITATALIALLCTISCAKMPQIGDHVRIASGSGITIFMYEGNITDIKDGLICLNTTNFNIGSDNVVDESDEPINACIGTGSVEMMLWLDELDERWTRM